jgi:hypothetical protein
VSTQKNEIQIVEFCPDDDPLLCPFCGVTLYDPDADEQSGEPSCPHVLFIAHDYGFEFRSERFNSLMGITGISDGDLESLVHEGELAYDGFTSRVCCEDAVKYAIYTPAPSFLGVYIGVAPITQDDPKA